MELGHLLTCSGLTHPEVSSTLFPGFTKTRDAMEILKVHSWFWV